MEASPTMTTETTPTVERTADVVRTELDAARQELEATQEKQKAAFEAGDMNETVSLGIAIRKFLGDPDAKNRRDKAGTIAQLEAELEDLDVEGREQERDETREEADEWFDNSKGLTDRLAELKAVGFTAVTFDLTAETPTRSYAVKRSSARRATSNGSGARAPREAKQYRALMPGEILTTKYKPRGGEEITVECKVLPDGTFEYNGKNYKSLSAVSLEATGKWGSGPRFFGLDEQ